MYSKGAREIIRHYQAESHLLKDQRWRLDSLSVRNKVTGITTHPVRGKDGRLVTELELQKEKTLFENAPHVDVGSKVPFYDQYLARADTLTVLKMGSRYSNGT